MKIVVAIIHVLATILFLTSPLLIPWWGIPVIIGLFLLQNKIFGGCVLTLLQFGSTKEGFYYHYLSKLGFNVTEKKVNLVIDYGFPLVILSLLILVQLGYVKRIY